MTWKNTLIIATAVLAGATGIPGIALAGTSGYFGTLSAADSSGSGYYGAAPDATVGGNREAGLNDREVGLPPDRQVSIGGSVKRLLDREIRLNDSAPSWATPAAKVADADPRQKRQVRITLGLRDPRGAQTFADAVSTPGSPQHGKFLTSAEFTERFGPSRDTVQQASRWLKSAGTRVTGVSANRTIVTVEGTHAQLEKAFDVDLAHYRQPDGTRVTVAPDTDLAVPAPLRGAVNGVLGLGETPLTRPLNHTRLTGQPTPEPDSSSSSSSSSSSEAQGPRAQAKKAADAGRAADGPGCARWWGERNNTGVPQKYPQGRQSNEVCGYDTKQIRGMHDLGPGHTGRGQTIGIIGAYNLDTIESDTNRAAARYGSPPLTPGQYSASLPPQFENQDQCAPESWAQEQALDVQAAHTTAPGAKIRYYAARSCGTGHMFAALNRAVEANQVDVISNSWGYPDEAEQSAAAHKQFGQIAVQAAAQGQSVLVSSGDTGDASGFTGKRQVAFPAASPWVTAVGGTSTALDATGRTEFSTGWADAGNTLRGGKWVRQDDKDGPFAGGAGGGRATYYAQPAYQKGVVPDAIAKGKRTLPDVASLADPYTGFGMGITVDGEFVLASGAGTSLATPLLAGVVADAAHTNGDERVGFLNPALYSMAGDRTVRDIKPVKAGASTRHMSQIGGATVPAGEGDYLVDLGGKPQSLTAAPGWDPLTGIGTPARGFVDRLTR
jgi:subtilase family serine protease